MLAADIDCETSPSISGEDSQSSLFGEHLFRVEPEVEKCDNASVRRIIVCPSCAIFISAFVLNNFFP